MRGCANPYHGGVKVTAISEMKRAKLPDWERAKQVEFLTAL